MIQTHLSPTSARIVVHRVSGVIDLAQAEQGAAAALRMVNQVAAEHGSVLLMLDLRNMDHADLPAHKAWSLGFARNPALNGIVSHVAIVGSDTMQFRTEQELMATNRIQFFTEVAAGEQWLVEAREQSESR